MQTTFEEIRNAVAQIKRIPVEEVTPDTTLDMFEGVSLILMLPSLGPIRGKGQASLRDMFPAQIFHDKKS